MRTGTCNWRYCRSYAVVIRGRARSAPLRSHIFHCFKGVVIRWCARSAPVLPAVPATQTVLQFIGAHGAHLCAFSAFFLQLVVIRGRARGAPIPMVIRDNLPLVVIRWCARSVPQGFTAKKLSTISCNSSVCMERTIVQRTKIYDQDVVIRWCARSVPVIKVAVLDDLIVVIRWCARGAPDRTRAGLVLE